jgi:hypothetical protein
LERMIKVASTEAVTQERIRKEMGLSTSMLYSYPGVVSLLKQEITERRYQRREFALVSQVLEARQALKRRGEKASVAAIARLMGVSRRTLQYYPKVKVLLEQVKKEYREVQKKDNAL